MDDYYTRASSRQFIPQIRVPTLILHAVDDPFMYPDTPLRAEELPEHGGFIGGMIPGGLHIVTYMLPYAHGGN